jgi:hypothetical protein
MRRGSACRAAIYSIRTRLPSGKAVEATFSNLLGPPLVRDFRATGSGVRPKTPTDCEDSRRTRRSKEIPHVQPIQVTNARPKHKSVRPRSRFTFVLRVGDSHLCQRLIILQQHRSTPSLPSESPTATRPRPRSTVARQRQSTPENDNQDRQNAAPVQRTGVGI